MMIYLKRLILAVVLTGMVAASGCATKEDASEIKADPVTVLAAVQTAVAIVQAAWERNHAVTQTDINTILHALTLVTREMEMHMDMLHIQAEVAAVKALSKTFERYSIIRTQGDQLNSLLMEVERSFYQLESVFANQQVYASRYAALAFNTLAAIRMVADMDYMHDMTRIRTIAREVAEVNNRLLAAPSFPVYTSDARGPMIFENCKVFAAPFRQDHREQILYSALSTWVMGYHGGREFRYYHAGKIAGACIEDKNGNQALRFVPSAKLGLSVNYSWHDVAPRMYEDNMAALRADETYRATRSAQDAIMPLVGAFTKNHNNGTVSCKTYCAGADWGRTGGCISAALSKDGTVVSCSEVPGLLNEGELTCQCLE